MLADMPCNLIVLAQDILLQRNLAADRLSGIPMVVVVIVIAVVIVLVTVVMVMVVVVVMVVVMVSRSYLLTVDGNISAFGASAFLTH